MTRPSRMTAGRSFAAGSAMMGDGRGATGALCAAWGCGVICLLLAFPTLGCQPPAPKDKDRETPANVLVTFLWDEGLRRSAQLGTAIHASDADRQNDNSSSSRKDPVGAAAHRHGGCSRGHGAVPGLFVERPAAMVMKPVLQGMPSNGASRGDAAAG